MSVEPVEPAARRSGCLVQGLKVFAGLIFLIIALNAIYYAVTTPEERARQDEERIARLEAEAAQQRESAARGLSRLRQIADGLPFSGDFVESACPEGLAARRLRYVPVDFEFFDAFRAGSARAAPEHSWLRAKMFGDIARATDQGQVSAAIGAAWPEIERTVSGAGLLAVIRIIEQQDPRAHDDKSFDSGYIHAGFYLVDWETGQTLCASTVEATNSVEITTRRVGVRIVGVPITTGDTLEDKLLEDLGANFWDALELRVHELVTAG